MLNAIEKIINSIDTVVFSIYIFKPIDLLDQINVKTLKHKTNIARWAN